MKEDDQYMTKIKIMSVRDEDIPYINEWAKQNNVDVDLTKEMLTETTVDTVKGFDGLSLSQMYPRIFQVQLLNLLLHKLSIL